MWLGDRKGSHLVSVKEDGRLVSFGSRGITSVLVEDGSSLDALATGVFVEIEEIHSIVIKNSQQISTLPLGSTAISNLALLDKMGRIFSEKIERGVGVNIEASHPKVLKVEIDYKNSTLSLTGLTLGESTLVVRNTENQRAIDVMLVRKVN